MHFKRLITGIGTRPYPLDKERRRRVMVALAEKDMSISALAKAINLSQPLVSNIINGRRFSKKTEQQIADFLGRPAEDLFPFRDVETIAKMREAETKKKRKAS